LWDLEKGDREGEDGDLGAEEREEEREREREKLWRLRRGFFDPFPGRAVVGASGGDLGVVGLVERAGV
jgi:hypothetical protein